MPHVVQYVVGSRFANTADQLRSARTMTKVMHGLSLTAEKTVHPTSPRFRPRFVSCIRLFAGPVLH